VWSPNWVHSVCRPIIGLLYLPMVIVRMENLVEWIGRGNQSTWRKPAPAPLCPPQIPLDQTRARTRAAAVGSQRLTAWAMVRPQIELGRRIVVKATAWAFHLDSSDISPCWRLCTILWRRALQPADTNYLVSALHLWYFIPCADTVSSSARGNLFYFEVGVRRY
jgi:hypothetical protein